MKKALFILFNTIITTIAFAQTSLNDSTNSRNVNALVIIYDVTYPVNKPSVKSICFNKKVTIIYGSRVVTTCYNEYGGIVTSVSNDCNESCYTLYPSLHFMLKSYRTDKVPEYGGAHVNQTISLSNKSSHILDFNCNEYKINMIIQVSGYTTKTESNIYAYNKLKDYPQNYTNYDGISGFELGSDIDFSQGCIQKSRAISITEQLVDSSMFEIPLDYSIYTIDEYYQKLLSDKKFRKNVNKEIGLTANAKWKIVFDFLLDFAPTALNIASDYVANNNSANIPVNNTGSSSKSPSSSDSIPSNTTYNEFLKNQADQAANREKQNSKDNYEMYMKLYRQEQAEANSFYRQYETHNDVNDLIKSKDCEVRAKDYLERANIWK